MLKRTEPVVLLPPAVSGSSHRLRAATVLPVLDERRTSHLVIWEAVEPTDFFRTDPNQRVFVCAYEAGGGAPFMTAEISPGTESAELASPHDSGAFAIGLNRESGKWHVERLSL